MKEHYCFTKLKLECVFLSSLLLAACASQSPAPSDVEAADSGSLHAPGGPEAKTLGLDPTDPEVMYRVLAGELLGAEGDMERAASEYLEAAMESDDPAIAARATRIALAAKAWQHAAMAADRWVVLQPENITARQTAVRNMMMVGDYVGAEHHLNGIIKQMPHDNVRAWALVTALLSSAANSEKAGRVLEHLIADNGAENNADAVFASSRLMARRGALAEAADLAASAIELDPDRAEFQAWAGRLAVNLEQLDQALVFYQAAWALRPAEIRFAMAYAELLKRTGDPVRAQEVLTTLEDTPETRFARIAFALDSGQRPLAEQLYREYRTSEYSDSMERAFQAAQAAELLGWPDEAVDWYQEVVRGERAFVSALRRAFLTAESGDLDRARNQLQQLRLRDEPEFVRESFMAESEILVNAAMPAQALELLNTALDTLPSDTQLLYARALVAVQLGELGIAEADLRGIIELEPQNVAALNALGYTLADLTGRYEEAQDLIHAAYAMQPEEVSIIDSMGWVAFRMGRLKEAERFLRDAWSRDQNAEIAAHLGEVLWVSEQHEEALMVWRDAYRIDSANTILNETMERFGVAP